ncbi:MAG: hypothetical protein PT977_08740 [Acidobacteriota bacterium]|nr:hypothetical protein [Acidobacteriota bacterium]
MKRLAARRLSLALAGLVAFVCLGARANTAQASSAVLAKDGTLYEVFPATYGEVITGANASDAGLRVLALRTTPPAGLPRVEIVGGTVDPLDKLGESIEFDETTRTVFVVYTRFRGFFADVHVAMYRSGSWDEGRFLPNPGLYVSVNPQLVVTRQTYTDADASGRAFTKSRTILSIVWWEESQASQARYAAVFIEDGSLRLDDVVAWNLNELNNAAGPTDNFGLPLSSYMHPGLQRDSGTNGGVLVSFANLATRTQQVVRLGFPDDLPKLVPPDSLSLSQRTSFARGHTPIGRSFTDNRLPEGIDLPFQVAVGTFISPAGTPTYYWSSGHGLTYLRGDSSTFLTIPFRPDFPVDRALAVVRDMSERQ